MKRISIMACILCMLLCCLCLSACGGRDAEQTPEDTGAVPEVDSMAIEAQYATLHYPAMWSDKLIWRSDDGNTVAFYAAVGDHERQHMFDIVFGGDEGYCVGTVTNGDETMDVNLVTYELTPDDTWSEDEVNTLFAMQEDANCIIQSLQQD